MRHPPVATAIMSDGNSNKNDPGLKKAHVLEHKRKEGKTGVISKLASNHAAASSTDTQDIKKNRFREYAELVNTLSLE